jgi:hypothetical protein
MEFRWSHLVLATTLALILARQSAAADATLFADPAPIDAQHPPSMAEVAIVSNGISHCACERAAAVAQIRLWRLIASLEAP